MANPTLILGANNWAIEEDNILGYALGSSSNQYLPREISFTRGSDATYTDSTGVIRPACWNLAGYSEEFNNAYWTKQQSSIIANDTVAPDGTLTADRFTEDTSNSNHRIFNGGAITVSNSIASTYSVYLKSAGRTRAWVRDNDLLGALFNLATGTIVSIDASATATITSIADGWYRCTITRINSTSNGRIVIYLDNDTSDSYTGNGTSGIYIWGAQLVQGSEPLAYLRTTDRLNIPRVDSSTGSKAFLLEPQRTNLALYSEQFNDAYWSTLNTTISANSTVTLDPMGGNNTDKFIANTTNGVHILSRGGFTSGAYSFTVYAKAGEETTFSMWLRNAFVGATFNLSNGTVSNISVTSATITSVGNGWYRCFVYDSTAGTTAHIYGRTGSSYVGNGSDGFYIFGAQLELGAYPTTYIPTQASTVTRLADSAVRTGIGSLIGQTEGVLFFDIETINTSNIKSISLVSGNFNNYMYYYESNNNYYFIVVSNGASLTLPFAAQTLPSRKKIALRYSENNFSMWVNGTKRVEDLGIFDTPIGLSGIQLVNPFNQTNTILDGKINSIQLYKTALTNAELASLTTL
jgi:hypothetical protein